uniref:COMM domain-containing protein n=1 Tax=Cyprinus carpio TaxID=7962 RepID=A0A8C2D3S6_CYPCA
MSIFYMLYTYLFIYPKNICAVYHNLKPAALRQQLENLSVRSERVEVWASAAPEVLERSDSGYLPQTRRVHLNLQMASSARSGLKAPHAVLSLGLGTEDDTERLQDVFVEFSHQDLLHFYNQVRPSPSDS